MKTPTNTAAPAAVAPAPPAPLLVAARRYAELGYRVFPLCPGGKTPQTEHGFHDATNDAAQVARWWGERPSANIGLATEGLLALDIDPVDGGPNPWLTPERQLDLACAPLQLTPRGCQYVFRAPAGRAWRNTTGRIASGVDTRADGGYIAVAPSTRADGAYRWQETMALDVPPDRLPEPPIWLIELLDRLTGKPGPAAPVTGRIADGTRNATLTSLAGTMRRRGMSESAILAALQEENWARCAPPLPEAEVAGIVTSIGHYAPASADALADGDVRLGREFAAAFAKRVLYCPDLESWLVWDGRRWALDAVHEAERLMQNLARDRLAAAADLGDTKRRETEIRFWAQAMRRNRIEAALWAARSDPRLIVRLTDLDNDPWVLNVANGTLNLKTGRLRRHDPADLITRLCPVEYRADADQSEWLRFLERVLPAPAVRAYLQRAAGYSLIGLAIEEILFFICGPTNGGKSTFVAAVNGALGDYAATANFQSFLAQHNKGGPRPDLVRLAGRRFVASVETEEGAQLAGGLLKWITGQDALCARGLYQSEVEFLPAFKLWLVSNFRPHAQDDDSALWRRLMLLPFDVSIPENERDPTVKMRLRDPAIGGPAVLRWAVEGCHDWQKHGLKPPPAVLAATRQWRAENDPIIDWLAERATLAPTAATPFKDLNRNYRQWAEDGGLKPISGKKLGKRLQDHGCRSTSGAGNVCIYEGISLRVNQVND